MKVQSGELTKRQREVARHATHGMSNKQIAFVMNLSEGVVKQDLHRVFKKLGIARRAMLILRYAAPPN